MLDSKRSDYAVVCVRREGDALRFLTTLAVVPCVKTIKDGNSHLLRLDNGLYRQYPFSSGWTAKIRALFLRLILNAGA
jgi:hypothetical protein